MTRLAALLGLLVLPLSMLADEPREPRVDGKTLAEWRKVFKEGDASERLQALERIAGFRIDAADDLIAALDDKDAKVRKTAERSLLYFDPALANRLAPRLRPLLESKDAAKVRLALVFHQHLVYETTGSFPPPLGDDPRQAAIKAAAPALAKLLADPQLRETALALLEMSGPQARSAVPVLMKLLEDRNAERRGDALRALSAIGVEAEQLPALVDALKVEREPENRFTLADLFASLPPELKVPGEMQDTALLMLHHPLPDIHDAGFSLVRRCDEATRTKAVETFVVFLSSRFPGRPYTAAQYLGRLGPAAKKAVPDLQKCLKNEDSDLAVVAAGALWEIAKDRTAVDFLRKYVRDRAGTVNRHALEILAACGEAGVPELVENLKHPDPFVRSAAVGGLADLQPVPAEAASGLLGLARMRRDQKAIRLLSLLGMLPGLAPEKERFRLPRMEPALSPVFVSARETQTALWGLATRTVKPSEAVPVLIDLLQDEWLEIRLSAARALAYHGPAAKDAVPHLVRMLADEGTCMAAVEALAEVGPEHAKIPADTDLSGFMPRRIRQPFGPPGGQPPFDRPGGRGVDMNRVKNLLGGTLVPALARMLQDEDVRRREWAVDLLGYFKEHARPAAEALCKALLDENEEVWYSALANVRLLADVAPDSKELATGLAEVLRAKMFKGSRRAILEALDRMKPEAARVAVPELRAGLKDADFAVRMVSARVLVRLTEEKAALDVLAEGFHRAGTDGDLELSGGFYGVPKAVLPILVETMEDRDPAKRLRAIKVLEVEGSRTPETVRALTRALKDPDKTIRLQAARMLAYAELEEEQAVPVLLEALKDPTTFLDAARGLSYYGVPARPAVAGLAARLETDPKSFNRIIPILKNLGREAKEAAPALIRMARDTTEHGRREVFQVLGNIGPPARDAVPVLREALRERAELEEWIEAASALWKIDRHADAPAALVRLLRYDTHSLFSIKSAGEVSKELVEIGESAVASLRDALKKQDTGNTARAALALWKINKHEDVVPALRKLLKSQLDATKPPKRDAFDHRPPRFEMPAPFSDAGIETTLDVLAQVGPAAREALPLVRECVDHSNIDIRRAARVTLKAIEGK